MKPLNNGQVGTWVSVHYSEVVLYWEVEYFFLCSAVGNNPGLPEGKQSSVRSELTEVGLL